MNDRVLLDADIREPLFDYLEQYYGRENIEIIDRDRQRERKVR